MLFYLLCAMLIMNALVLEGVAAEDCKDRGSQSYCNMHKNNGDCDRTDYKFIMKANCRKTSPTTNYYVYFQNVLIRQGSRRVEPTRTTIHVREMRKEVDRSDVDAASVMTKDDGESRLNSIEYSTEFESTSVS
ncbi:hypothetical protein TELCIR_12529 [Teladorsagia circumcincta]|uniref:ShKT domain-containing protein n=1 Tax=Teladorsagia circumcincta TaxID=45464 RepID=A0A2G9U7V7_TELCI|nr:hypothetical protein TELCIR_12529 [Teladorsagia circumcincta]